MSERSIKVSIGGRIYPITVDASEEEHVRKAAQDVEHNLKHLQENYAVKDKQDLLAMTALQFSMKSAQAALLPQEQALDADWEKVHRLIDSLL